MSDIIKDGHYRPTRNANTYSIFGTTMKFNLESFPLLTTKKMFLRGIFEELKFFLLGQTDTKILEAKNVNIWKGNTSSEFLKLSNLPYNEGDMGPMYGFQLRHFNADYNDCKTDYNNKGFDQLKFVIETLRTDKNQSIKCINEIVDAKKTEYYKFIMKFIDMNMNIQIDINPYYNRYSVKTIVSYDGMSDIMKQKMEQLKTDMTSAMEEYKKYSDEYKNTEIKKKEEEKQRLQSIIEKADKIQQEKIEQEKIKSASLSEIDRNKKEQEILAKKKEMIERIFNKYLFFMHNIFIENSKYIQSQYNRDDIYKIQTKLNKLSSMPQIIKNAVTKKIDTALIEPFINTVLMDQFFYYFVTTNNINEELVYKIQNIPENEYKYHYPKYKLE